MPYITKAEQKLVEQNPVYGRGNPGVLNYRLTRIIIEWLGKEPRYADFDAAIGALECAKLELYRRSIGPYEDKAIAKNGDVYPDWLLPEPDGDIVVDEPTEAEKLLEPIPLEQARYFL
jgi:hypothetical protein